MSVKVEFRIKGHSNELATDTFSVPPRIGEKIAHEFGNGKWMHYTVVEAIHYKESEDADYKYSLLIEKK